MAYVYLHLKKGTLVPFYVGIGKESNGEYFRAFSKKKSTRSELWQRTAKKHGFDVKIVIDNISWEEACKKEVELISFYGRIDLRNGILVNHTIGGDGAIGTVYTEKRIAQISERSKGSKNGNSKVCVHRETGKEFGCLKEACKVFNLSYRQQCGAIRNKLSTGKFYFKGEYFELPSKSEISSKLGRLRIGNKNCIMYKVIHIKTGKIFPSIKNACLQLKLKYNTEYNRLVKNLPNRNFNFI